jgi:hypothetical protein
VTTATATSRILTEDVLTINDARKEIASVTGQRPDISTMTRWIHRGLGGTKLEAVRIGRQLITSKQAITRFIETRSAESIGK